MALSALPAGAARDADFGAFPGPRNGQNRFQALDALEADLGRKLDVVRVFKKWDDGITRFEREAVAEGRALLLSVTTTKRNGTKIKYRNVGNAKPGDAYFKNMVRWAKALRALNGRVILVFNHEPEGDYNQVKGTAGEYKKAFGRWVQVMRQHGGNKLEFATSNTSWSFRVDRSDRRHVSKWLPNKIYWDHMGVQVYNFYDCRPGGTRWVDADVFTDAVHAVARNYPNKGVWFTEVGTVEDPAKNQRKANWVKQLDAEVRSAKWGQFEGMSWYHTDEKSDSRFTRDCDWWIDSSGVSERTFRDLANSAFWG